MSDLQVKQEDVIRAISPKEEMFYGSEEQYFGVGRAILETVFLSLRAAGKVQGDVKRILDLPCGHGRILRYLKAAFPQAEITACDLNRDGVDFCASTLGALPVYSVDDPAQIQLPNDAFDLIVVVSLFTHFDADLWTGFLERFRSLLCPGGVLVFTAHGRYMYDHAVEDLEREWREVLRPAYDRSGFGYSRVRGQISEQYGVSLSAPFWVVQQIERLGELRLVHMQEHGQDVYACIRDKEWPVRLPPLPGVVTS